MQETLLHQTIEIFLQNIKTREKTTLGKFLDFAYFSTYLQPKETAWKRGDATRIGIRVGTRNIMKFISPILESSH